jgi:hypothetical protein
MRGVLLAQARFEVTRLLAPRSNSVGGPDSPHCSAVRCVKILLRQAVAQGITMQRGSLAIFSRKEGPDGWKFRWSEKGLHGTRVRRKRVIGTVDRYPDKAAARTAMAVFLTELNSEKVTMGSRSVTVA